MLSIQAVRLSYASLSIIAIREGSNAVLQFEAQCSVLRTARLGHSASVVSCSACSPEERRFPSSRGFYEQCQRINDQEGVMITYVDDL